MRRYTGLILANALLILLTSCAQTTTTPAPAHPTSTQAPPISTPIPPTQTSLPTSTIPSPTDTPQPTEVPPSEISPPPTATILPTLTGSGGGVLVFVSERGGRSQIYLINADGSGLQQLTDDHRDHWYPSWSPDGSMLAFHSHRSEGVWSIYTVSAHGGDPARITSENTRDAAPVWSPDGSQILFSRDDAIWVMSADGSDPQQITGDDSTACCADWSPNGAQIAFESTRDGNAEIYIINADGSNPKRLTNDGGEDWWPDWSPDGRQIAFKSDRDGDFEIYVINTDGSNLRQLTDNDAEDGEPDWSPDGARIAFESNRQRGFNIYVMNADGSDPQQLTNTTTRNLMPVWNPTIKAELPIAESITETQPDGMGTVSDVDGNIYPTVLIADQWWMAASLNVTRNPDGEPLTGYCYDDDEANCTIYGRLYTWDTAMNGVTEESASGICPAGWHLPADDEWTQLFDFLGGEEVAGGKMKAVGTDLWHKPNRDATNSSGFNGLPAGGYMVSMDLFEGLGVGVHFWSSTENLSRAGLPTLHKNEVGVTWLVESKSLTASVRCVMD